MTIRGHHPTEKDDFLLKHAIDVIKGTYGDIVSVDAKKKDLVKFGTQDKIKPMKAMWRIIPILLTA